MKEMLLAFMSGALETIGESKLVELLQKAHDSNPERYERIMKGGYELSLLLVDEAAKTKTPIDDAIGQALKEALETSAANNDVTLPDSE